MPRWKQRPEGSTWGEFGLDDQLGRLNLLTAAKILEGIAEVKEGISFCLSLPLEYPGGAKLNPRRQPPRLSPCEQNGHVVYNMPMNKVKPGATHIVCDDYVTLWTQYSTQWDSLAHNGYLFDADGDGQPEIVYYNGYRGNEDIRGPVDYMSGQKDCPGPYGAWALSVANMAVKCIQGRAVLLDLHAHFGRERHPVTYADVEHIMAVDKVVIEKGDILLLYTGYSDVVMEMKGEPDLRVLNAVCSGLDGRDARLLEWITDSGIAAICADNHAVEAYDSRPPTLPLHIHCLFKIGVPLAELWWLKELADWLRQRGRTRCLLTAPPLRLSGAVGSPVTPVATV